MLKFRSNRVLAGIIAVALLLPLAACGREAVPVVTSSTTPSVPSQQTTESSATSTTPQQPSSFPAQENTGTASTSSIYDLMSALADGDLSGIVGTYYSDKYGYATIFDDGITFANVTDYKGYLYQNLKYVWYGVEAEMEAQMRRRDRDNIYLNYLYVREHSNHTGPDLVYGQGIVYIFPAGSEIAWDNFGDGSEDSPESDTAAVRLYVEGSEHGSGGSGNRLDIGEYFFKVEESPNETTSVVSDETTDTMVQSQSKMVAGGFPEEWALPNSTVELTDFNLAIGEANCSYQMQEALEWSNGTITLMAFLYHEPSSAYGIKAWLTAAPDGEQVIWGNQNPYFSVFQQNGDAMLGAPLAQWLWNIMAECDTATSLDEVRVLEDKTPEGQLPAMP
jgi:hypothetical protein